MMRKGALLVRESVERDGDHAAVARVAVRELGVALEERGERLVDALGDHRGRGHLLRVGGAGALPGEPHRHLQTNTMRAAMSLSVVLSPSARVPLAHLGTRRDRGLDRIRET